MMAARFALAGLVALSGAVAAKAQSPVDPEAFVGVWEVAANGKDLTCRLQLRGDAAGQGFGLGAPPACRRALPILAAVARWQPVPDGRLVLSGPDDKALLEFGPPDDKGARKGSAGDQDYTISPVVLRRKPEAKAKVAARAGAGTLPQAESVAPPPVKPAATAPEPQAIPGRYAVLRSQGRSGCIVTLETATAGTGRFVAGLAEGCQDKGMIIFSPVAWRYSSGQLVLTAAKGHEVTLVFTNEGFRKDPPSGAELRLTREP
jgi:hypothetical protein